MISSPNNAVNLHAPGNGIPGIDPKTSIVTQDFSLKDKVIVVTGGTGILGEAFINGIVRAGGAVGILGRNKKIAQERADRIKKTGGQAVALIADVTHEEQLMIAREKLLSAFGK